MLAMAALPIAAQDDVTTRSGPSALDGAWITGPAANPLSFLNGPAYRTFGSQAPYDFPDLRPMGRIDEALPHWLRFGAEERFRFEGHPASSLKEGGDDSYFLNRLRIQMNLQVAPWFKVVSQVQDSRPIAQRPPVGPPNENRWDLKLAYAEFGDPERHWISVRVGRQLINFNHALMANSEWRNQGRSYDAAAVNLRGGPFRLGLFAASAVAPLASGVSHHRAGNNIYGAYGGLDNLLPRTTIEPFVLWRVQPSVAVENTAAGKTGHQDLKAYGLRVKGRLQQHFDYSGQAVVQRGSDGPDRIRAWAMTTGAAWRVTDQHWHPRVFSQYDFASGDRDPADGVHGTFDTLYPTTHDRFGTLDLFSWQNLRTGRMGVTVEPHQRWTVTVQFLGSWLASALDGAYDTGGNLILRDSRGRSGTFLGREADVYSWYEINRHVNIGAGAGLFFSGPVLMNNGRPRRIHGQYFAINFKDAGA